MRLTLSVSGLQQLVTDLIAQGVQPAALLLSPNEKRDLKHEILGMSKQHSKDAEEWNHDLKTIAIVAGIPIMSHKDVTPGTVRVIDKRAVHDRNADHRAL